MLRDAEFGPVRLRAFGNFTLRTIDPKALLRELVGTDGIFEAEAVGELLRSVIASAFADLLGESNISALDLAAKYSELAEALRLKVCERIDDEYGLEVPSLQIVNIALPESVEKAIDTRTQMGVIGDMGRFQQFQMANALSQAAQNPSGGAGEGVGLGVGFAMANQTVRSLGAAPAAVGGGAPQPPQPPAAAAWHVTENGQSLGPYSIEQLAQAAQQRQLAPTTLVWTAGMAGWTPAAQVPQLAALFAPPPPVPPPPPPPPAAKP